MDFIGERAEALRQPVTGKSAESADGSERHRGPLPHLALPPEFGRPLKGGRLGRSLTPPRTSIGTTDAVLNRPPAVLLPDDDVVASQASPPAVPPPVPSDHLHTLVEHTYETTGHRRRSRHSCPTLPAVPIAATTRHVVPPSPSVIAQVTSTVTAAPTTRSMSLALRPGRCELRVPVLPGIVTAHGCPRGCVPGPESILRSARVHTVPSRRPAGRR